MSIDRLHLAKRAGGSRGRSNRWTGSPYLVSLDEGLPALSNLDSYIRIVKDKATLRKLIFSAQKVIDRCLIGEDEPDEILAGAEESPAGEAEGEARSGERLESPATVIGKFPGGLNAFLDPSQRVSGLSTGFAKFDEMTGGRTGELLQFWRRVLSMGKTALALNIAQHVATTILRSGSRWRCSRSKCPRRGFAYALVVLRRRAWINAYPFVQGISTRMSGGSCKVALADLTESPRTVSGRHRRCEPDGHPFPAAPDASRTQLESEWCIDYLQLMSSRGRI